MDEFRKLQFEHASRYFAAHSSQRMAFFQYALTFWATTYAAIGAAKQYELEEFELLAAVVGVGATLVLWMLDQRTRQLVKLSEAALRECEEFLSQGAQTSAIRILQNSDRRQIWPPSYTTSFRLIYLVNLIAFLLIASPSLGETVAQHLVRLLALVSP